VFNKIYLVSTVFKYENFLNILGKMEVHIIRENLNNKNNDQVYGLTVAFESKESCLLYICECTNW
jgi:hypothetical protein